MYLKLGAQQITTQIYIAPFNIETLTLKNPLPITTHKGYVNQPAFTADSLSMLYVMDSDSATDIFRYDIAKKTSQQVTYTKSAEFSPLSLPYNGGIIAVRVTKPKAEGEHYTESQELWHYSNAGNPNKAVTDQHRVGYFTIFGESSFAMFIVGNEAEYLPNELVTTGMNDKVIRHINYNVGRSLSSHPFTKQLTYVDKSDSASWKLNMLQEDGTVQHLMDLPMPEKRSSLPRSEDICWLPDGRLLLSNGNKIYVWSGRKGDSLKAIYQQKIEGGFIARIAVSPDAKYLAFVIQQLPR